MSKTPRVDRLVATVYHGDKDVLLCQMTELARALERELSGLPLSPWVEKELGRRKGWNSAIRRCAEVAEHYAKLMNSEAAQRVAVEIRAMLSEPDAAPQVTPEMSTSTADVTPADAAPLSRLQRRGIARLRAGIAWREFYNRCFGHVTEQERAPFIDIVTDAFTQPFCDE